MTSGPATGPLTAEAVEPHLEPLRAAFQTDGADLRVVEVLDGQVVVDLVVTDETCMECIVPPPLLAAMVEDALESEVAGVTSVVVNDPR